jgi:O-antigen/teichoic acid export membrane protein
LIEELRLSFSYASDVFVMRSFSYIDVVILSVFCSPIQVGIYQAGQKLVQGVLPLAQAINNVVLPKVSVSKNVSWSSYVLFFKIMSFVGFVGFMGFVFFGDSVVLLVFGSKYQDLLSYMPFFGIIVFLRYSNFSSSIFLTALGSQKERVLVNFLSMLVFLVLTPVLVSEYAIKGLLISLVSVSLMTGVLYRFNIKKLLSKVRYDSK